MNASPVRSFGKYLLDDEIARGGMSRVFLARLRGLGGFEKRLIVKQILPELASDPRFISMFVQEANTLVRMSHPHIAPVYELGVVDGVYFLAMEYVEGATLSQILKTGSLAPELVAHFGAQICDALHYAHDRFSIIHRDVTPRNVIIDEEGHARLLDFGIAAPVTGEAGDDGLFGTPGYLSPEQACGAALGPRTDVFSLGAVLFETLTARRAFFARNIEEAQTVLTMDGPDFYPDDGVPEALSAIVDRALERDADKRHASARELGRALRSWLATHAPEGVGPELGERVRDAGRAALVSVRPKAIGLEEPHTAEMNRDAEVKTLATSRILDDLLEGKVTPIEAPTDIALLDRALGDDELGEVGTTPLKSRTAIEDPDLEDPDLDELAEDRDDDDDPRTLAIRNTAPPNPTTESPDDERRTAMAPVAALLAAFAAVAITWFAWPTPAPIAHDTSPIDTSPIDASPIDASPIDASPIDTSPIDTSPIDTSATLTDNPSIQPAEPDPLEVPQANAPPTEDPPSEPRETTEPTTQPARAARATLTINALPWAEAELDGRAIGTTPVRRRSISAGRHTLILRNPNLGNPARTTFEVPPGGAITLIGNLETGSIERRNR